MVYILIINYTLLKTISASSYRFHGDLLWAAFIYCIYTCLSDLWALPISLKNYCPCQDLNPGPSQYQVDIIPTELSWLGLFYFQFWPFFFIPTFWIFAPCICPTIINAKAKLKKTLYIVTDKAVIVYVTGIHLFNFSFYKLFTEQFGYFCHLNWKASK